MYKGTQFYPLEALNAVRVRMWSGEMPTTCKDLSRGLPVLADTHLNTQ